MQQKEAVYLQDGLLYVLTQRRVSSMVMVEKGLSDAEASATFSGG